MTVPNDVTSHDAGKALVFVLLDLRAAFDTADHNILLKRLEMWAGLNTTVLKSFKSSLEEIILKNCDSSKV